jgi:ATP-dependent RNA helicase SUPV3L1/SUV3
MGLNLDVDHIAFASRVKFDGRKRRRLSPAEMGQIAGRAGRFRTDGTFGETADCAPFEPELVAAIESHTFEPVDQLVWRNAELDFASVPALLASLSKPSGESVLRQNPDALDEWVLRRLKEEGAAESARGVGRVRRLWEICCLPDFRKAGPEGHLRLVESLLGPLADPDARLSDEWVGERVNRLDDTDGDISALQDRVAAIRTWTYAAYRPDWMAAPEHWRDATRAIEDRLSDALHERLTLRFVDRRTSALIAGLKREDALATAISPEGEVTVEGHVVGRLRGLVFEPVISGSTLEGKAVRNAALAALRPILAARLHDIALAMSPAFRLDETGRVHFDENPVARLIPGRDWLSPNVELIGGVEATPEQRTRALARLGDWVAEEMAHRLPTHVTLKLRHRDESLPGAVRGLAFRVMEAGACVDLRADDPPLRLTPEERETLKGLGVRAGRLCAHVPEAQKPHAQAFAALLRGVSVDGFCPRAPLGAGSFTASPDWTDAALSTAGYLRFGPRAVRADLAERLAWEIDKRRREAGKNLFAVGAELASVISCPGADFVQVLKGFGLQPAERDESGGAPTLWRFARRAGPEGMPPRRERARGPRREGRPADTAAPTQGEHASDVAVTPEMGGGAEGAASEKPVRERRGAIAAAPGELVRRRGRSRQGPRPNPLQIAAQRPEGAAAEPDAATTARSEATPPREPRRDRERDTRTPRPERDRGRGQDRGTGETRPRREDNRPARFDAREPRPLRIDPNSPFAILANLIPPPPPPPPPPARPIREPRPPRREREPRTSADASEVERDAQDTTAEAAIAEGGLVAAEADAAPDVVADGLTPAAGPTRKRRRRRGRGRGRTEGGAVPGAAEGAGDEADGDGDDIGEADGSSGDDRGPPAPELMTGGHPDTNAEEG